MNEQREPTRWQQKHEAILAAAGRLFLSRGYPGTSMDDVAAAASVSKQTVYKHFADKEELFAAIVLATTDQVGGMVSLVTVSLGATTNLEQDLRDLARSFLKTLMQPQLLQLRRLVIATADQFPHIGTTWYEQGFERVLATLAQRFQQLTERALLDAADPLLAAHHFVGLLLWIPVNRAMFTGDHKSTGRELDRYADSAVRTFLAAYSLHDAAKKRRPAKAHA